MWLVTGVEAGVKEELEGEGEKVRAEVTTRCFTIPLTVLGRIRNIPRSGTAAGMSDHLEHDWKISAKMPAEGQTFDYCNTLTILEQSFEEIAENGKREAKLKRSVARRAWERL
jgi:hypothetical protein